MDAMETQAAQNRRRSERVLLRMSVMVLAENEERRGIQEEAKTQVVNAHGGLMTMKSHLHMGQSFPAEKSADWNGNELPRSACG